MASKLLIFCVFFATVPLGFAQMPAGFPPAALTNATNILQELLNQASQLTPANGGNGGGSGSGGITNPFVEFFRNIMMFMLNMVNNFIKMLTGGLGGFGVGGGPMKFSNGRLDLSTNEIGDTDMKTLHAKAHGPDCQCTDFNRMNLPGFTGKDDDGQPKKLFKRSVEDATLTADQAVNYFDAQAVEKLLKQFAQSRTK